MTEALDDNVIQALAFLKRVVGDDSLPILKGILNERQGYPKPDPEGLCYAIIEAAMDHSPGWVRQCHPDGSPMLRNGHPVFMKVLDTN